MVDAFAVRSRLLITPHGCAPHVLDVNRLIIRRCNWFDITVLVYVGFRVLPATLPDVSGRLVEEEEGATLQNVIDPVGVRDLQHCRPVGGKA